jgi:glycosyltransferase involved in cell wall biosynthesis
MKIIFYSAIKNHVLFERVGFYRDDIAALKLRGDNVFVSNSIRELIDQNFDLIVCYFYSKSLVAGLVSRLKGSRVIFTGGADQISPKLVRGRALFYRRFIAFFCLLISNRIMLSCKDDFDNFKILAFNIPFLIRKIELSPHVVIPFNIDRNDFKHDKLKFNAFTIAWMGSILNVQRKGVDRSIRLIGLLRECGVDASLSIAGTDGPGKDYLIDIVKSLCLESHIHFLGIISESEKEQLFISKDVYLQLSEHEGFGVAAAEAFFSGVLVAHSNAGGLSDVIGDNGIIIDVKAIDNNEINEIRNFYKNYLNFEINYEYINEALPKYSLKNRSDAFFKKCN